MRLSIAIEFADGKCQQLSVSPSHGPVKYTGALAPFVAQLAASYLRVAATRESERFAHNKSLVSYRMSLRDDGTRLDRSV